MKKSYLLLLALSLVALVVGCKDDNQITPEPEPEPVLDPVLDIAEEIISASADGGTYTIAYLITNPVEGATVSVTSTADWVHDFDCNTSGEVSMIVDANITNEDRSANLTFEYRYGEGLTLNKELIVHQVYQYDCYHDDLMFSTAAYFYGRGQGFADFAMYLTDLETVDGSFVPTTTVFRLDLITGHTPEDYSNIRFKEGHYTTDQVDLYNSFYGKVNEAGDAWEETAFISAADLTISYEGDVVTIEGSVTDQNNLVHYLYVSEAVKVDLYDENGFRLVDYDLPCQTMRVESPSYVDDNGEVMLISSMFVADWTADYLYSKNIYMNFISPYDDYELVPGTYTVSDSYEPFTITPGYVDPETLYTMGTYALDVNASEALLALFESGTVDVMKNTDGTYTFEFNLQTAQGFALTGTCTDEFIIPNIPGSCFSTLEDDYTVDLSEAGVFAFYSGDDYGIGAGLFTIQLEGPFEQNPDTYLTEGRGEKVYLELLADSMDYEAGVPTGKYTAANPDAPQAGQFIPGYQSSTGQGLLFGTHYVGGYSAGFIDICAPAVSGELDVTNHGDGTYTLKFAFLDDRGNTWDGTWSGEITFYDFDWTPDAGQQSAIEPTREAPVPANWNDWMIF